MRHHIASAAIAAAVMAAPAAQAFTLPAPPAAQDNLVRVAGGCGLGWHRGPWGGCRPNYYYRPYAYLAPAYAPGCWWRATPYGAQRVCAW
jgi:hypothetical protein